MTRIRKLLYGLAALLGLVIAGLLLALNCPPSVVPYKASRMESVRQEPALKVRFLGVATVLLDDGETALLTDGFFSRPSKLQTFFGKVEPDIAAIGQGLARIGWPAQTGKLAAIIPLHSHYDHVMDAPEVARRTGALLIGSESTAMVGRGWGLPEAQMRLAQTGQPMHFGAFTVTLYPSTHAPTGFTGGSIAAPIKPPVRANAYQEGGSYAVLIEHGNHKLLMTGTAGFVPNALRGVQADVVLLGIGALGQQSAAYRAAYWQAVVAGVGARRVIPIHWDDFWRPSTLAMQPMPFPLDRFTASMDFLQEQGRSSGVDVRLPLEWQTMDVFADLPPPTQ